MREGGSLTDEERGEVHRWLRSPRGRYSVDRASQLSGVPRSTIYDWNKNLIVVPDFSRTNPMQWSYRDLVFLRLTAWLRGQGMPRLEVAERVVVLRSLLDTTDDDVTVVHSDGNVFMVAPAELDRFTGAQVMSGMLKYVPEFDLAEAVKVEEIGAGRVWGPNLVHPSAHSSISPWVMAGDPCVTRTRIPTSTVYALHRERGLDAERIAALYKGLESDQVDDAIGLEERLRKAA